MWLFASESVLSIVTDNDRPDFRLVRSRYPFDIHRMFPMTDVFYDADADYPYRAFILASDVARAVAEYIESDMPYGNFKSSVPDSQKFRQDAYYSVWLALLEAATPFRRASHFKRVRQQLRRLNQNAKRLSKGDVK